MLSRSFVGCAVLAVVGALLAGCRSADPLPATADQDVHASATATSSAPTPVLAPDLLGLPSARAGRLIGELEAEHRLGLTSSWGRPVAVRCGVRPGTVVRQAPPPGTPLGRRAVVRVRTAALDLDRFRGPCGDVGVRGLVGGPDAALARQFYRFAADPSLGAPFVEREVWVGLEDGPVSVWLSPAERSDLTAWELRTAYAERSGPFSALDVVAASGGHVELHRGVLPTCGVGAARAPTSLRGLRAVTLTAPSDVVAACMEWWGVTLFLEGDLIRGVALRMGAP